MSSELSDDSSSSAVPQSPEVQFRETDGQHLMKQARIWLEEVLNERYDADENLADLLVDGQILIRVSTKIRSLLHKFDDAEPTSPKSLFPESPGHGSSGRYLPYSNVDSFLKTCQKLGLTGVDVFSPPDVVEKKNIRRVCLCIRALSKKARGRQLDVPDFDNVTHSVHIMPTDFVGGMKENFAQGSSSSPSPRNIGVKGTSEKLRLSPLTMNHPDEDLEQTNNNENAIHPETPPLVEQDSGFSCASRGLCHSDDELASPNGAFQGVKHMELQLDAHETLSPGSANSENSKKGFWVPLMVVGAALLGAFFFMKSRTQPAVYEVKRGDTLSRIAKKTGKSRWEELVCLNPEVLNPDLIYPNEKIRLH